MRISTTVVESFRLFSDPEQEWMSEADMLATIRGEFMPTPKIRVGQAYGRILEDPDRYLIPGAYQCDGYTFALKDVDPALVLIDRRGVFEAKGVKSYGPIDVVAKADHLYGAHLTEFKTTDYFAIEKYLDSCQWKFMVEIFEPVAVTYHVFSLDDHGNSIVELKDINSFNVFPYDGLHDDCCELLQQFVHFVTVKGLDGFLRQRQAEAV